MYVEKVFACKSEELVYYIDYPRQYDCTKQYPVIIYLHGYGGVLSSKERFRDTCILQRERIPDGLDFILIAPHCTQKSWLFRFETLCAFVDEITSMPFVDVSRVYLCGSSMGGYSTLMLLLAKPDTFSASIVCCGGGQYWAANFYKDIPIRLIHGALDTTVLPRESEIMAERINAAGGKAELIVHKDLAHDVWSVTFTSSETYQWLLSHKKV